MKFIALYMAPAGALEEWAKVDEATRVAEEAKMKAAWGAWVSAHRSALTGVTAGTGKTKRVTSGGVEDTKNNIMLYSLVEAASHEAAAALFADHPHFGIPGASIEVMPINVLPGMEGV